MSASCCRTRWTRSPRAASSIRARRRRSGSPSGTPGCGSPTPGIGLTEADAHRFLATIGSSSKRDDLAGARREFLGQFGIGLLACFTVADQIRVVTRSAREPDAPTVEWLATSDGSYGVRVLAAHRARAEPGTTVYLAPRPGAERWFAPDLVAELAREYGALLPYEVTVESAATADRCAPPSSPPVWDRPYASTPAPARRAAGVRRGTARLRARST